MSATRRPERPPGALTPASRIVSATLLILIVASVAFAPQVLRLTLGTAGTKAGGEVGDQDEVADDEVVVGEEDEKGFWPGMWLIDRSGQFRIHVFSDGHRASGVGGLVHHLKHEDAGIRESAARWLGAIGPAAKNALPALREALNDPDEGVRTAAKDAIKSIKKRRPAGRR
jgi:hypothetical protein